MDRRNLLRMGLVTAGGLLAFTKASAQLAPLCQDSLTPAQTKGPFYPVVDQIDKDADLVKVIGRSQIATGKIVIIQGQVTDQLCQPVAGVLVEIWQACESGRYNHSSDTNTAPLDPNFQYWGKAVTDAQGHYAFRTIQPGAYPADKDWIRPPHIHFQISKRGYKELITQLFFSNEELNDHDLILQDLSPEEQAKVVVDFTKVDSKPHPVGEFNIQIMKLSRNKNK